jgi:paraquat-inducible protein B
MEDIPVKEIASNLNQIVATVNKLMSQQTFAELDRSLRELTAATRSTRLLMEYLEEHPEALLKGKPRTKDK